MRWKEIVIKIPILIFKMPKAFADTDAFLLFCTKTAILAVFYHFDLSWRYTRRSNGYWIIPLVTSRTIQNQPRRAKCRSRPTNYNNIFKLFIIYLLHSTNIPRLPHKRISKNNLFFSLFHKSKPFEKMWVQLLLATIGQNNWFGSKDDLLFLIEKNYVSSIFIFLYNCFQLSCGRQKLSVFQLLDTGDVVAVMEYFVTEGFVDVVQQMVAGVVHVQTN